MQLGVLKCATHPNASKVNSFNIVNSFLFSIIVFYRNSILLNCICKIYCNSAYGCKF